MKIAILVFIVSLNLNARELSFKEKATLIPLKKTLEVKSFMENKIKPKELNFRDYISYQLLKKSCAPIELILKNIEKADEDYKDQSKALGTAYSLCSEGALGLSKLYIVQNP